MASITGTVTDYDGNVYNIVRIGDQEWLESNLKATHYADGSAIPANEVMEGQPTETYGKLYKGNVAADKELISGWHVPSNAEWETLADTLGGKSVAGVKMKSTTGWTGDDDGNGTNESGFNALPGGRYEADINTYYYAGEWGWWWSSTPSDDPEYPCRNILGVCYHNVSLDGPYDTIYYWSSIRLVRQVPIPTIEVPDILISKGGQLHSLRGQTIWKDGAGHTFNAGCGVVKNGILYALKPVVYMQTFTPTGSEAVGTEVTLIDERDGISYRCIKMADGRWWMGENFRGRFGAFMEGQPTETYGLLYQWETASVNAPENWHLPTEAEWLALGDALGGADVAGGKMKQAGTILWKTPNTDATNESGFNGLPGGFAAYTSYMDKSMYGFCWSAESLKAVSLSYNKAALSGPNSNSNSIRHSTRYILNT